MTAATAQAAARTPRTGIGVPAGRTSAHASAQQSARCPPSRRSMCRSPIGRRAGSEDLGAVGGQRPRDDLGGLGEDVGQRDVERVADGGEQLARGLLAAALHLRQVAEADPRRAGTRPAGCDAPPCARAAGCRRSPPASAPPCDPPRAMAGVRPWPSRYRLAAAPRRRATRPLTANTRPGLQQVHRDVRRCHPRTGRLPGAAGAAPCTQVVEAGDDGEPDRDRHHGPAQPVDGGATRLPAAGGTARSRSSARASSPCRRGSPR